MYYKIISNMIKDYNKDNIDLSELDVNKDGKIDDKDMNIIRHDKKLRAILMHKR